MTTVRDRRSAQREAGDGGEDCRGPDCNTGEGKKNEQSRGERGGGDVELGPHQDRRLVGQNVAEDAAGASGQDPHGEGRDRRDPEAQRLGRAEHRVSREPQGVEPQQRLAREPLPSRDPHQQCRHDAN